MSRKRLLIADDHNLVAEACRNLLEPEFEVVGIVNDGRAMLQAAVELKPDLIIVDVGMPVLNGLDAAERVKKLLPAIKLIFLSMNTDAEVAAEALRRGASGYIPKNAALAELTTAIREASAGRFYLSPLIAKETINVLLEENRSPQSKLTRRQREVLQLLAEGLSLKEAASVLKVKPGTVAFHKYRIMSFLDLRTTAELLQYAFRHSVFPLNTLGDGHRQRSS